MFCYIYGMAKNQFTHESFNPALLMAVTVDNYWSHVQKTDDCWLWTGSLTLAGYGSFHSPYIATRSAHRISWILSGRELASSDTLDHSCPNRNCVNPGHLEPMSIGDNVRRSKNTFATINAAKTHCKAGHPFDEANTYHTKKGGRCCRICRDTRVKAYIKLKQDTDFDWCRRMRERDKARKMRLRVKVICV